MSLTMLEVTAIWQKEIDDDLFNEEIVDTEKGTDLEIEIDLDEMNQRSPELVDVFMQHPSMSMSAIKDITTRMKEFSDVYITVKNFDWMGSSRKKIREMRARDIEKMLICKGIVRTATVVFSRLRTSAYVCMGSQNHVGCGHIVEVEQEGDEEVEYEGGCPSCGNRSSKFVKDNDLSSFTNFMKCDVEEEPEGLMNRQPERLVCEIVGPLTEERFRIGTGDRVSLIGVYKVRRRGNNKSLNYDRYMQVTGVYKRGRKYEELNVNEEDEKAFLELSKNPNLLETIAASMAPDIYGHEMEKRSMALQMFGGNLYSNGRRGDIHILLVGDPGIGKSKLIEKVVEMHPQVVKATGAPTTSVGLTATVKREEETGQYYLEAGAAVMADGGLLIIDEFDKMKPDVSGALHEIMEDQRTTINKATISAELPTKCSILAIMNPKGNRFNNIDSVKDQINLVPSLLSRFDLIFALKDTVEEVSDRKIAGVMYRAREGTKVDLDIEASEITKYIMYARSKIKGIKIADEAKELLTESYITIRNMSSVTEDMISITARQLEGTVRLAEAHAKMRLSSTVEKEDAMVAIELLQYYLNKMCRDKNGRFDVNRVLGSDTGEDLKNRQTLMDIMIEETNRIKADRPEGYTSKILLDRSYIMDKYLMATGLNESKFDKELQKANDEGKILLQGGGSRLELAMKDSRGNACLYGE